MKPGSVLLVNPNTNESYRHRKNTYEHLGLSYLSSYLRSKGVAVDILDARAEWLSLDNSIAFATQVAPEFIGFSLFSGNAANWVWKFSKKIREILPESTLIAGGYYPTLQTDLVFSFIPEIDIVVFGEGEQSLEEIISHKRENRDLSDILGIAYRNAVRDIIHNERRNPIRNLDELPFPHRYIETQEFFVEGSRGCYWKCSFCAVNPTLHPGSKSVWRYRTAESMVEELALLRQRYPEKSTFRFIDCDFLGAPKIQERNSEFARLAKERLPGIDFSIETSVRNINDATIPLLLSLKDAGLSEIYVGIESGSDSILARMRKGYDSKRATHAIAILEKLGIFYKMGFMMFTPWTTERSIEENIAFLRNLSFLDLHYLFGRMDVIPGTPAMKTSGNIFPNDGELHGYYTYENEDRIESLKNFCNHFSEVEKELMGEIFNAYEKIRFSFRRGDWEIIHLGQKLRNVVLDIFEYAYREVNRKIPFDIVAKQIRENFLPVVRIIGSEASLRQ